MRLRLLRRRLTISAPRVAIRSALPWPLRWLALALLLGLCAALALWAFEFGKTIAGIDSVSRDDLRRLEAEVMRLRDQARQRQTQALAAESLLAAERAAQQSLLAQLGQLQADNRTLREDLGFFEKLIPAAQTDGLVIRALQAEMRAGTQLRWQALIVQAARNAPDFTGRLELLLTGTQDGKPWAQTWPAQEQPLEVKRYRRAEGVIDLPPHAVVKTVTARVLEGTTVRATKAMAVAVE